MSVPTSASVQPVASPAPAEGSTRRAEPHSTQRLASFEAADREYRRSNRLTRQATDWRSPDDILDAALLGADPGDPELRAAADASRPPTTLLAGLARADLAAGSLDSAAALLRRALARDASILHLQALYRRATGAEEPSGAASRFCSAPFESLETAPGGEAYFCCPAWLPIPIGNLSADGAEDVWNSPIAQEIRASILDGSYRYCSRVHCPKLSGNALPHRSEVTRGAYAGSSSPERPGLSTGPSGSCCRTTAHATSRARPAAPG